MLTMDTLEARTNPVARRYLTSRAGDEFEVDSLVSGDFASMSTPLTLGVEHKAFNDLVHSLSSGRFDEQMSRLLSTYDVPVIAVTDFPVPKPNGKVSVFGAKTQVAYSWVIGALGGWALRGVLPMPLRSLAALGPTVYAFYKLASKEEHRSTYSPPRLLDNLRPMTTTEKVLVQLPGVGPERAAKLKDRTPRQLGVMALEDWQKILGPVVGQRAWAAWNGVQ